MSSRPAFEAAIFDFDGVLADTIPIHYASFRRLFEDEGVEFTFEDYQRVANGAPRDKVIRSVLGENLAPERFQRLMDRKEEIIFELAARDGLRPIKGVLELVARIRELGLKTGVASSSRTARRFVEALGATQLFDTITDATQTRHSKPHPEVFLLTAHRLGVDPAQCVAFEDAVLGIESARSAGMSVVAITTTTSREALSEADWIIDSFTDFDPTPILLQTVVTS